MIGIVPAAKLASAETPNHGPIEITSDADFATSDAVIGGNGTPENPYIIANWVINASSSGFGIHIANTRAYFIIRNVTIYGGTQGILLENVSNGVIENVQANGAQLDGAAIVQSEGIQVIKSVSTNSDAGIHVYEDSSDVLIQNNTLIANNKGIILAGTNVIVRENDLENNQETGITVWKANSGEIYNNTITSNGGIGVFLYHSVNLTIEYNNISSNSNEGIHFESTNGTKVIKNSFLNNNGVGISIGDNSQNNLVIENHFENNNNGINVDSSSNITITDNEILNSIYPAIETHNSEDIMIQLNYVYNTNHTGIWFWNVTKVTIQNNTVIGSRYEGIWVQYMYDSIIANNNLQNNSYTGITLIDSDNNVVSGNSIEKNHGSGIQVERTSSVIISENTINYNKFGIYLRDNVLNITISSNFLEHNTYGGISLNRANNNLLMNNTILNTTDGDGIYIWNATGNLIQDNYIEGTRNDGIILQYSPYNTIINNYINHGNVSTSQGIDAHHSPYLIISENTVTNSNNGIYVFLESHNVDITRNTVFNNGAGIVIEGLSNITVLQNTIYNNSRQAIVASNSEKVDVIDNRIENSGYNAIEFYTVADSKIASNVFTGNMGGFQADNSTGLHVVNNSMMNMNAGVVFRYGTKDSLVENNVMVGNEKGLWLWQVYNNTFVNNTVEDSSRTGVFIHNSTGNVFYLNHFENFRNVILEDSIVQWHSPEPISYDYNGTSIKIPGTQFTSYLGNYWNDYNGIDSNEDGIGDTPYIIDRNNVDEYPLVVPSPPVVSTDSFEVTNNTVVLRGILLDTGRHPTEVWIEYGTDPEDLNLATPHKTMNSTGIFEFEISGLDTNKKYYFRAVAKNILGTTYGYTKEFSPIIPSNITGPVPDEVVIHGYSNANEILTEVANGKLDFGYWSYPLYSINNSLLSNLTLAQRQDLSFNLVFNPVHDADNPYIITLDNGSKYFNPFAIREVRFAINWLINRRHVVHDILQDSGNEKFSPFHEYMNYYPRELEGVVSTLGLTEEGNEVKALTMINEAMNKASQELAQQGYTLEKVNGKWYFEGKPVKIVGLIRIEDERNRLGNYVADLLEEAGFTVGRKEVDRRTAGSMVYVTDPSKYEWNYYTEGWMGGGNDYPRWTIWQYYSSLWAAPGLVGWKWSPENTQRTTVEEILKFIGNGNLEGGIQALGLQYYDTLERISPILNWTADDIGLLLYQGYIDTNNDGINDEEITSLDQFWDLNRLGLALGIYESNRIFIVNKIEVYPVNRENVKNYATDVNLGLNAPSIITAETNDGKVDVGAYEFTGELFASPANPNLYDSYSGINSGLLKGLVFENLCNVTSIEYNVSVPSNAVKWDDINNLWVPVNVTSNAPVKATLTCRLGAWHDGQKMSLADYVMATAFAFEITYKDDGFGLYPATKYLKSTLDKIIGFEFKNLDENTAQIVIYQNQSAPKGAPLGEQVAFVPFPLAPWQLYYSILELIQEPPYNEHMLDREGLDQLNPEHAKDIKEKLEFLSENAPIPEFLENYTTLQEALGRYNASIMFIEEHDHALIGDGPFYLEYYDLTKNQAILYAFRDPRYPYTPHEYMEMYNTDNTPPTIGLNIEPQTIEVGNSTLITWSVTDDHKISEVKLVITCPDGSEIQENFDPSVGSYTYNYTVEAVGTYTATVIAKDEFGNTNEVSMEFYGKKTVVENITISNETSNVTVQNEDLELGIDVNKTAVSNETQIMVNATITSNEEDIKEENVTSLAVAPVVTNTTENETQSIAPVKYVKINVETAGTSNETSNQTANIIEKYTLKIKYTDEEIQGIDESTLSLYYWNGSAWIRVRDYINSTIPNGPFVYNAGVNTEENYIWAVVNHFSVYALGGVSKPIVTIISPENRMVFYTNNTINVTIEWKGDDKLGIDHYEVKLNNDIWINVGTATQYTFKELPVGRYVVCMKAVNVKNSETVTKLTFNIVKPKIREMSKAGRYTNMTLIFWMMYKYQKDEFNKLYNKSLSIGISNETLQNALKHAQLAEEYYQETMKSGLPMNSLVPRQIKQLRLAFIQMKKAVKILERAIKSVS